MKKWTLQIVVVLLLIALALTLRNRGSLPEKPQDTVSEFFEAAGEGDDRAYLRLVTGELRKSLENDRSQAGAEAFRESLRRTATGIKGLAVTEVDQTEQFVTLDVEIVFADRNERQQMLLERKQGGWAIAAIEAAEMLKPPIPYGTPVFEPPEEEQPQAREEAAEDIDS